MLEVCTSGECKTSREDTTDISPSQSSSAHLGSSSSVSKSGHFTPVTKKRKLAYEDVSPVSSNSTGTTIMGVQDEVSPVSLLIQEESSEWSSE